jgi:hypothetical protein
MADEAHPPHTVQPDLPAQPHPAESREETIERVVEEADQALEVPTRGEAGDPTSRRGVNRAVFKRGLGLAGIGAVVGAVLAVILSFLPGPVETDTVAGTLGYALVMAVLLALVVGLIGTLILLAREDGRVEREVEHETGREPEAPGSPIDPTHDVPSG